MGTGSCDLRFNSGCLCLLFFLLSFVRLTFESAALYQCWLVSLLLYSSTMVWTYFLILHLWYYLCNSILLSKLAFESIWNCLYSNLLCFSFLAFNVDFCLKVELSAFSCLGHFRWLIKVNSCLYSILGGLSDFVYWDFIYMITDVLYFIKVS